MRQSVDIYHLPAHQTMIARQTAIPQISAQEIMYKRHSLTIPARIRGWQKRNASLPLLTKLSRSAVLIRSVRTESVKARQEGRSALMNLPRGNTGRRTPGTIGAAPQVVIM